MQQVLPVPLDPREPPEQSDLQVEQEQLVLPEQLVLQDQPALRVWV